MHKTTLSYIIVTLPLSQIDMPKMQIFKSFHLMANCASAEKNLSQEDLKKMVCMPN